jgi:hypothetical protein
LPKGLLDSHYHCPISCKQPTGTKLCRPKKPRVSRTSVAEGKGFGRFEVLTNVKKRMKQSSGTRRDAHAGPQPSWHAIGVVQAKREHCRVEDL